MMEKTMKNMTKILKTIASISLLILTFNSQASDLTIPNQFTSGTRAVAADVNANFDAAAVSVNDNQTQISNLLTQITALTASVNSLTATVTANSTTITSLETTITENEATIALLEADSVVGLSGVLSVGTDNQGNTAAIFSGVNLHVNNGGGDSTIVNNLGNIIVGYDEVTSLVTEMCSLGINTDQTTCEDNGGLWSNIHKTGSHNIIVGRGHNYSQYGGLVLGRTNNILGESSTVLGGEQNTASGGYSTITGGIFNVVTGDSSSIGGGQYNQISGFVSVVMGGSNNQVDGHQGSISGGQSNAVNGNYNAVGGGFRNTIDGTYSSISGGRDNVVSSFYGSISGGRSNLASGQSSSISGGRNRTVLNEDDWGAGALFEDN